MQASPPAAGEKFKISMIAIDPGKYIWSAHDPATGRTIFGSSFQGDTKAIEFTIAAREVYVFEY